MLFRGYNLYSCTLKLKLRNYEKKSVNVTIKNSENNMKHDNYRNMIKANTL